MMPLTMLNPGESASIVRVGGNEETKRFLENLGFVAGSEVKVISSNEGKYNCPRSKNHELQSAKELLIK